MGLGVEREVVDQRDSGWGGVGLCLTHCEWMITHPRVAFSRWPGDDESSNSLHRFGTQQIGGQYEYEANVTTTEPTLKFEDLMALSSGPGEHFDAWSAYRDKGP